MNFLAILDSAHPYLDCFDYDHYPRCFAEFEKNADGFFRSLDANAFDETAEGLLDQVTQRWGSLPFRLRRSVPKKDKTVLALFFTPAAMRHSEAAGAFAAVFRESWNRRFPKYRYLLGDYDAIMKGFDTEFLGIKLRKSEQR